MRKFGIFAALVLTGCVTAAWAANTFGNTTINGTLTVVGNVIAQGLSGLESLTLTDTAGVPTLTLDGTSAGGPGAAYNSIHVKAKKTGGAAVDTDELPLSITSDVWNGSAYVDGPKMDMVPSGFILTTPDNTLLVVSDGGVVASSGSLGAAGAVTGASLATSDGGLTMASSGLVQITADSLVGTSSPGQVETLRISATSDGAGAESISFFADPTDVDNWKIGLGSSAWINLDGLNATAAKLDAAINTGLTLAENLFLQDGAEFVLIQSSDGTVQATGWQEGSTFRATGTTVLTPAASVSIDCLNSGVFHLTADQNTTIGAPSNASDAQEITIVWKQNGTGGWGATWNSAYRFGSISSTPTSTAGKTTIWKFLHNNVDSKWDAVSVVSNL